MTIQQFLEELEQAHPRFDWALEPIVRKPERRSIARYRVLGRVPDGPAASVTLDPLRAVCYLRTGKLFKADAWSDVADALGMELSVAAVLLAAANDRVWSGPGTHRAPADHLQHVRARMLGILGLPEPRTVDLPPALVEEG